MNVRQLARRIGERFLLRPVPRGASPEEGIVALDDEWRLDDVTLHPAALKLSNTRTGLSVEIKADNFQEYRSPNFLLLRCELEIRRDAVVIEPLTRGTPIRPEPLSLQSIQRRLCDVPEIARDDFKQRLVGARVYVTGQLGSVRPVDSGNVRVGIMASGGEDVFFIVPLAEHPRLAVTIGDEPVEATGVIRMWQITLELEDVGFRFLEGDEASR